MTEWTTSAREELDGYLDRVRGQLQAAETDPAEVLEDLRRHVEEEVRRAGVKVVTRDDVQRILLRLGDPEIETSPKVPPPLPASHQPVQPQRKPYSRHYWLGFFGVLLPAFTIGLEFATGLCAGAFFDPIPSAFHLLLVGLVPVANLLLWLVINQRWVPKNRGWVGWLHGAAVVNRPVLALVSYLLGESCTLVHQSLYLKSPGPDHLPLHTDQDQTGVCSPFPHHAQTCNATWALTDYTVDNGAICFVPGSHRLCRAPTREEATDLSIFEPVEAEAGSVIVWHGNTWHGALRRAAPGVRVSIVEYFGRWFLAGANTSVVTEEMIARNPRRFAELVRGHADFGELGAVRLQAAKATHYG